MTKHQIVTAVRSGNTKLLNQAVLLLEAQFCDKDVDTERISFINSPLGNGVIIYNNMSKKNCQNHGFKSPLQNRMYPILKPPLKIILGLEAKNRPHTWRPKWSKCQYKVSLCLAYKT